MTVAFYIASGVAIIATLMVITRSNVIHALLYLVVSLLSVAVIFLVLGAPFAAALEVIIYAGAIMVLFVFVVMMLGAGTTAAAEQRGRFTVAAWSGPALLTAILFFELVYILAFGPATVGEGAPVSPADVSASLLGRYAPVLEMMSLLLLVGLIGAYHLARHLGKRQEDREPGGNP